jgi:hypothetical protein
VQSLTSGCAEALVRQKVTSRFLGPLPVRIRDALNGAQFDEIAAVFAVARLMVSSNFVGRWTGRSSGLWYPQNSPGVNAGATIRIGLAGPITHQAADLGIVARHVACWQCVTGSKRDELPTLAEEERTTANKQPASARPVRSLIRHHHTSCDGSCQSEGLPYYSPSLRPTLPERGSAKKCDENRRYVNASHSKGQHRWQPRT